MIDFIKDRILLFVVVIAGDWVSLSALIKADEIRHDAITTAIVVSLLPSIIISLLVEFYLQQKLTKRNLVIGTSAAGFIFWIGFIIFFFRFSNINDQYGKVSYPTNINDPHSRDSVIVGGCHYTHEAQAEVDAYTSKNRTLTPEQLFEDFNYNISAIWSEADRDCARRKILNAFAIMLAFLIAGITLTAETIIALRKKEEKK